MDRAERQGLFISKFCSIVGYTQPLSKQIVPGHYNSLISNLIRRYNKPAFVVGDISQQRTYHSFRHAVDCCFELDEAWDELRSRYGLNRADYDALFLALAYHDCIYDTKSAEPDSNEVRSANFAIEQLTAAGVESSLTFTVGELIRETDHSIPIADDAKPIARIIRDIDLVELGADWPRFDHNFAAIREEYSWVPEADFMLGRMRFMEAMASRPHVFATSYYRERLEEDARNNLSRHIFELGQIVEQTVSG
jgi:predicted metal-dependent HD superfamily phosphohydrolase